jgi:tRNA (adenine22-N1)-methyltransferase
MTTPGLPRRLRGLLELLPAADTVADVAAGHGRLAVHLAARARRVIATEATDGPYAELCRNLARWDTTGRVEARRGSGLEPLAWGEVEGVVVAGLGARRLSQIAAQAPGRGLRWVALQCIQHPDELAGWVRAAGWTVVVETACEQRGRLYSTWVLEPGGGPS